MSRQIRLKGFVIKKGQLVRSDAHLDVSTRLKRRHSKRVRYARKGQGSAS